MMQNPYLIAILAVVVYGAIIALILWADHKRQRLLRDYIEAIKSPEYQAYLKRLKK